MRERIYEIIELSSGSDKLSSIYDYSMMLIIIVSLVPLAFKVETLAFQSLDRVAVSIFIADYILRLITADYKYGKKSVASFVRYPFSFFAVFDLIAILPSFIMLNSSIKLLRLMRMARAFRVFRVFKALRYSRSVSVIMSVLKKSSESLIAVGTLALAYILVSALVIFNVEPDSFDTLFEAFYWATVSLTTVGYGDIYPVTTFGRVITMVSSLFGIAIVALPAGIITAGYMTEIGKTTNGGTNE